MHINDVPPIPERAYEQTMRVVMDEKQLHRLLDPILVEVNDLRRRLAAAEQQLQRVNNLIAQLEDDGK